MKKSFDLMWKYADGWSKLIIVLGLFGFVTLISGLIALIIIALITI